MTLADLRPSWLAARSKNAVRRPAFVGGVAAGALITAAVAFVVMPKQQAQARRAVPTEKVDADTIVLVQTVAQAHARAAAADAALENARRAAATAAVAKAAIDTLDPVALARRDSLNGMLGELQTALATAETAPLPSSYRSLASTPALSANARVRALIDTLGDIERERDALGASGGADPIFVALTSRLTEIGRSIQTLGEDRRVALREEIASAGAPLRRRVAVLPQVDTMQWIAERDSARSAIALSTEDLESARKRLETRDLEAAEERAERVAVAPPMAILGASIVFGVFIGFAVALFGEIRRPRVADDGEIERATGARVLSRILPGTTAIDRARRSADRAVPRAIDLSVGGFSLAYLQMARPGAAHMVVTVVSDDTAIAAVVAANMGAIAVDEARATLVIDTDSAASPLATALEVDASPGVADVIRGGVGWPEATVAAQVGRDRDFDVIPAGKNGGQDVAAVTAAFARDAKRFLRHYDAIFVVASTAQAEAGLPAALPIRDTVVCVRPGHTEIRALRRTIGVLKESGANLLGVVVWDRVAPMLQSTDGKLKPRMERVSERQALAGAR